MEETTWFFKGVTFLFWNDILLTPGVSKVSNIMKYLEWEYIRHSLRHRWATNQNLYDTKSSKGAA